MSESYDSERIYGRARYLSEIGVVRPDYCVHLIADYMGS